jgi:hypothetical protein
MKRRLLIGLAGLLLLLAACGANATRQFDTVSGELNVGGSAAPATTAPAATDSDLRGADEALVGPTGIPAASDRKVIYDGQMQLEASDTRATFDRIVQLVQTSGGFIAATGIGDTTDDQDQPTIALTVRLPADDLTATLSRIRKLADRVVTESLQSQDVTDQFVDIEAQLRNLTALETELLALLAELRDNNNADPAKLLQVFDQIRITRGEIEQLEGRRQLLQNLVALATLQIGIAPLPAAASIVPVDPAWEPGTQAKGALRDLIEALQGIGSWLIRFGLYTLPVLILVVGPMALIGWFILRRARRQHPTPIPTAPPEAPAAS